MSVATGTNALGLTSPKPGRSQREQRLDADHHAVAEADHRLEVQDHLIGSQRVAQRVLDLEPSHGLVAESDVEQRGAVAPSLLGVVHRQVGVLEHLGRIGRTDGVHHPDAGRDHDPPARELDGGGERSR